VSICYKWHPFYGEVVPLVRGRAGSHCLRCEFADGTIATIPLWMTDAEICAQMSLGEPQVSLAALTELRAFLDWLHRNQANSADRSAQKATLDSRSTDSDAPGQDRISLGGS
jgi:hypothetical protein